LVGIKFNSFLPQNGLRNETVFSDELLKLQELEVDYMTRFIPGLQLSEQFHKEVVRPLLKSEFLNLEYSAGLIGSGSEVLGFGTLQSTDHCWGPRLLLFLHGADHRKSGKRISSVLSEKLPHTFRGYSTNFSNPDEEGNQLLEEIEERARVY